MGNETTIFPVKKDKIITFLTLEQQLFNILNYSIIEIVEIKTALCYSIQRKSHKSWQLYLTFS